LKSLAADVSKVGGDGVTAQRLASLAETLDGIATRLR
jgi:hypothetical protein